MSTYLSTNLKFLRRTQRKSQSDIGFQLNKAHTSIGNWEKGISQPSFDEVEEIARIFEISPAELMYVDLQHVQVDEIDQAAKIRNLVQVKVQDKVQVRPQNEPFYPTVEAPAQPLVLKEPALPKLITVDSAGNENVLYVPVKARAGYLAGFADPVYVESLAAYRLPGYNNATYRIFEVDGISMYNTLQDKDRCVARWAQVSAIRDDRVYVLVTRNDGLLIKRCINRFQEGKIICKSDNNHSGEYPPIVLDISDIQEVWYVVERWTRQLPPPGELYKRISNLEADMALLKDRLKD